MLRPHPATLRIAQTSDERGMSRAVLKDRFATWHRWTLLALSETLSDKDTYLSKKDSLLRQLDRAVWGAEVAR
jgi:hypothetical protein